MLLYVFAFIFPVITGKFSNQSSSSKFSKVLIFEVFTFEVLIFEVLVFEVLIYFRGLSFQGGEDKTWTLGPSTPLWTGSMDHLYGPGPWTPYFSDRKKKENNNHNNNNNNK